jgi:hypothetical protein
MLVIIILSVVILTVIMLWVIRLSVIISACPHTKWLDVECHYAMLSVVMLRVVMLVVWAPSQVLPVKPGADVIKNLKLHVNDSGYCNIGQWYDSFEYAINYCLSLENTFYLSLIFVTQVKNIRCQGYDQL